MTTHALRVPVSTGDTSKAIAVRDDLITGDNGGVLFCADLAFGYSYPAGPLPRPAPQSPLNGALIRDMTLNNNDASSDNVGGIVYAGGGFDFTGITHKEVGIEIPATVTAQLAINNNYVISWYTKLPSTADWNQTASINSMASANELTGQTYQASPQLFVICQAQGNILDLRVQQSLGSVAAAGIPVPTGLGYFDDEICQISLIIGGGTCEVQIRNQTGGMLAASAGFTGNSENVDLCPIFIGGSPSFANTGNSAKYRIYRTFVEDISVSGRTPNDVLMADFARVMARGAFS